MNNIVKDTLDKLKQCDDFHNRCDYLLEHSEITYLLEYINEKEKEIERLDNIINKLKKYCNEEIEDYDKHIKSQYITDIVKEQYEGEKVCFEDMLYKIKELKGSE